MELCEHPVVLVDCDHPHGTIAGVPAADLRASDRTLTRPVLTLRRPRCGICGATLTRRSLGPRIRAGGDLYDERFRWSHRPRDL
jgi:hypothetical protein